MLLFILLTVFHGAICGPPTPDHIQNYRPLVHSIDPVFGAHIQFRSRLDRTGLQEGYNFKNVYVDQEGNQFADNATGLLQVSGTEVVKNRTLNTALRTIYLQCRNMPSSMWLNLCAKASVGVFTKAEATTIFPEYLRLRDRPECAKRCKKECKKTCTGDGRKYDSLAGLGGKRATCVEDNILCNRKDPYRGISNIRVHEFTHTIQSYGLDAGKRAEIKVAFKEARKAGTWIKDSYAMSTPYEYFVEASGVFFHANKYAAANGGMSRCWGKRSCDDQRDARSWLDDKDPKLFSLLSYTFTNDSPSVEGGLARCVKI